MSHLPRSVHLIAEAPEFDVVWIFVTVGFSQITVVGAALEVAVLQHIFCIFRSAGSEIDGHHDVTAGFFRPVRKLIQTEFVCLNHAPGKIRFCRPFVFRTYAVFPVIARDKVSARVTDDRYLKLFDKIQGIFSEALLVGESTSFLIDAFVNGASQVLDKGTEDSFVNFSGKKIFVNDNLCFFHT